MTYEKTELDATDEAYPDILADDDGNGPTLYVTGDPDALRAPKVAVIGTRRSTPYGEACARMTAEVIAELNATLLTGATLGCGAAAARETMRQNAKLIVVTATGADRHYPESSKDVFEAARRTGAVVSVARWNTPAIPANFSGKNRLMAELADIVVVCEAAAMSGVTTMATDALKMGKPVLAFPGPVFANTSAGTNALIADGARIVLGESTLREELSKELGIPTERARRPYHQHLRDADEMLRTLGANPMRASELADALGLETTETLRRLSVHETFGRVTRMPDGTYSLSTTTYLGDMR